MKKFVALTFLLLTGFLFSACTLGQTSVIPDNNKTIDDPSGSLNLPIPTVYIKTQDIADQKLVDELNQYQDSSFDKDFSEIESQL